MRRPFKWRRAIAPATYDFSLFLVGVTAYFATLGRLVKHLVELWATRPLAVVVFSLAWAVAGVGMIVKFRSRLLRLVIILELWRRQRRGT